MKSVNIFFFYSKSVIVKGLLNRIQESAGYVPVYLNFSAQTSSARTQEIIESKLERKRKNILGKTESSLQFFPHELFIQPVGCIQREQAEETRLALRHPILVLSGLVLWGKRWLEGRASTRGRGELK